MSISPERPTDAKKREKALDRWEGEGGAAISSCSVEAEGAVTGTPKVRSKVNVLMNRLVREGAVSGFKTNFGYMNGTLPPHVTVVAPDGRSQEEIRALVVDAITNIAVGIDVTVEPS